MSASWYDVLGVDPEASREEIRSAWEAAIEDLDPGSHMFALYTDAVKVLLNAEKRAEYDATLIAGGDPAGSGRVRDAGAIERLADVVAEDEDPDDDADGADEAAESEASAEARAIPLWVLAALAAATIVIATVAGVLHLTKDDPAAVEQAMGQARQAAESNVGKLFTYDYRTPESDHAQALQVVTGDLKQEYQDLWNDVIAPNLEETQGSASSTVLATGLIRASDDGKRVELLVVMQSTAGNAAGTVPITLPLTVTMVEHDGTWLIERSDLWEPDGDETEPLPTDPGTDPSAPTEEAPEDPTDEPSGAVEPDAGD